MPVALKADHQHLRLQARMGVESRPFMFDPIAVGELLDAQASRTDSGSLRPGSRSLLEQVVPETITPRVFSQVQHYILMLDSGHCAAWTTDEHKLEREQCHATAGQVGVIGRPVTPRVGVDAGCRRPRTPACQPAADSSQHIHHSCQRRR